GVQRADAALAFVHDQGPLLGLRAIDDDVVVTGETRCGSLHFVKLEQRYRGIPVRDGALSLAIDEDGGLHMVAGQLLPDLELTIAPSGRAEAAARALAARAGHAAPPAGGVRSIEGVTIQGLVHRRSGARSGHYGR